MSSFNFKDLESWFNEKETGKVKQVELRGCSVSVILAVIGVLVLFALVNVARSSYTEWLWFTSLEYGSIFTTVLKTRVLLFFIAAFIFSLVFAGNVVLAARLLPRKELSSWLGAILSKVEKIERLAFIAVTALFAFMFGMVAQAKWDVVLTYFHGQPFGINDPVFNKDVGFYVFTMPFYRFVQNWFLWALILSLMGTVGIYFLSYTIQRIKFDFARRVMAHGLVLFSIILGLFAWNYRLNMWELVFSKRGVAFGASYADLHAKLPAQWILLSIVVVVMIVALASIYRRDFRWPLYGLGAWIAAAIVIGGIYPGMVQRFQVQPNELVKEQPYIGYNIKFTREAFGIDEVDEQSFPAEPAPTTADITGNEITIKNIRLWDHRPLKDTYNHIQSIRLYYDFNDVDVDRYQIGDEYRQVMVSARELSVEKLPQEAQRWVNRRLQFTHGYGIALSPVNEISKEGLPLLLVKDIPPSGIMDITRPEIYFGEKTNQYVIVGGETQEFDYPIGEQNAYNHYDGKDGISIASGIRRLLYAWEMGDFNILISKELTPRSKILYHRNIQDRVHRLAPFLLLDEDPYLVVMEGRLLWIQDAYTVTDRYPYSEPLRNNINYMRNSVKVVIDAYDGNATFYVADPSDAMIRTYQGIFPDLFQPLDQMPPFLRGHLRYPVDLFNTQAMVYQSYHMQDARVFYNKEDLWARPREFYAGQEQLMEPYYIIMRLPEETREEFLLMLPFTPVNKNNTIGWLAARSDGENYGKLLAYHYPKQKQVSGPSQIENRIQQDIVITEQLALWGRGGSRVIRGNLLLIPLGKSNIYVEPIFLQAEGGGLPELKRVIVAAGERIVMQPTLEQSINAIFGQGTASPPVVAQPPPAEGEAKPVTDTVATLAAEARQHYEKAQEFLKEGNWAGYGRELELLKEILDRLAGPAAQP